ncbi:hypothetical protein AUJ67_03165 [Candidatus Desantisbacteria bacterium CG1_02_49_89]|nr:MAG: hypothetical protein AUJ67_03165 [Candidatus Desantisbacteria bacterium CG1_02_49_89]
MQNNEKEPKVKILRTRVPKTVICPFCGMRQPFRKETGYWRTIKDMNLDEPVLLKIQMVCAKCLNPVCKKGSFSLPVSGIEKYARATIRLKKESVATIIEDNSTLPRAGKRLSRSFNTTGSKSSIDRWKHREADKYDIKDIIARLDFSGVLSLDEYWPRRSSTPDFISGDGLKCRILYAENVPERSYKYVKAHLEKIKELGINPWLIIFDTWKPFPGAAREVFPNILIQIDYFHIMKVVHWHLRNALAEYRKMLKEQENSLHKVLWKNRKLILKNLDEQTQEQRIETRFTLSLFKGTVVEDIITFKEWIRDIFLCSRDKQDALNRRNRLYADKWHLKNRHFRFIMKYLMSHVFNYMTTYLEHPGVPRSGNSENLISVWRQMESVRYGFKSNKGALDHLKLYQISKYLEGKFP